MIRDNFEKCFWIPIKTIDGFNIQEELINNRGIYKDTFGSSQAWADYQFRCNFPVAMVVVR